MIQKGYQEAYWILRLLNVSGLGNAKVKKILDGCRAKGLSISEFIERIMRGAEKTNFLKPTQLTELLNESRLIDEQWKELQEGDIKPLIFGSDNYPAHKMSTPNNKTPALLFVKGNLGLLDKPSLGFCGSRKASEKGLKTAWDCADQMARKGVNIVSGYASGVDMTTHKAALEAGGSTTIVLAEGILNFKIKKALKEFFDEKRVLVLSEFLPKLPWSVRNAMQRNSTICVLSDAMVLIEAEEKGGSISAGRTCLAMQRPLFAPVYGGMPKSASGNRMLLDKGAFELKKSRKTDRANLIQVEDILFRRKEVRESYEPDVDSDREQLALFENAADYSNQKNKGD